MSPEATLWHVEHSQRSGGLGAVGGVLEAGTAPRARLSCCKPAPGSKKKNARHLFFSNYTFFFKLNLLGGDIGS